MNDAEDDGAGGVPDPGRGRVWRANGDHGDRPAGPAAARALDLAKREPPDVKFESARKAKYRGQDSIEIRGRNKEGKIREVEIDLTGKLLEVE